MHILVHIGPRHGDRGVNMIMFSYKYCLSAPIISREYTKALHIHIGNVLPTAFAFITKKVLNFVTKRVACVIIKKVAIVCKRVAFCYY